MTRTFLVALEIDPIDSLEGTAELIEESLMTDGLAVISVKPWESSSLNSGSSQLLLPFQNETENQN